jgi:hypothetical protein
MLKTLRMSLQEIDLFEKMEGRKGHADSDIDPMVSQRLPARAGSGHAMHAIVRRRTMTIGPGAIIADDGAARGQGTADLCAQWHGATEHAKARPDYCVTSG